MTWRIVDIDRATIPDALLPLVKAHLRVDFADDDTIIKSYVTMAIDMFERFTGWRVFETTVSWLPVPSTYAHAQNAYVTPVQPIHDFTAASNSTDVTAQYEILQAGEVEPVWLSRIDKTPFATDLAVTLLAGYADADDLPPPALEATLRLTGTLYENRESVAPSSLNMMPEWANDLLAATWIPRC